MSNVESNTARLCLAIVHGQMIQAHELISRMTAEELNLYCRNRLTPLMLAVEFEMAAVVQALLDKGVSVNACSESGETALHIAVDIAIDGTIQSGGKRGDEPTEIIQQLLSFGADVSAYNHDNQSPLDWAKSYQSQKIQQLLKQYEK